MTVQTGDMAAQSSSAKRRASVQRREQTILALDVGGTGVKGELIDPAGHPLAPRVRLPTPYPLPPQRLVDLFKEIAAEVPQYERVAVGFPGVVRGGRVLSAPHFVRPRGEGSEVSSELEEQWNHFDLAAACEAALGHPTRVANDADVQGLAVIQGKGLEVVVTLGTGFGSAVFRDGQLALHLELAHHPLRKGKTYNDYLGNATLEKIGEARWNRRVRRTVEVLRQLFFFDHLYIGGGNSAKVRGELGADVTLVDNSAGMVGGAKLWAEPVRRGRVASID